MFTYERLFWSAALAVSVALFPGAHASAGNVTYDFGVLPADGGSALPTGAGMFVTYSSATENFTQSSGKIIATARTNASDGATFTPHITQSSTAAFGDGEQGLGSIRQDGSNTVSPNETSTAREIGVFDFVTLDFSDVLAKGNTLVSLTINSIQGQEGYTVYESATAPTTVANIMTETVLESCLNPSAPCGSASRTIALPNSGYKFFTVTAYQGGGANASNDVLIQTVVVNKTAVPEPASFALLSVGLAGLAAARKRQKARSV